MTKDYEITNLCGLIRVVEWRLSADLCELRWLGYHPNEGWPIEVRSARILDWTCKKRFDWRRFALGSICGIACFATVLQLSAGLLYSCLNGG